jgi:hypothetical protein
MTTAASQETAGWICADSGRQVDGPPHTRALEHATDLSAPHDPLVGWPVTSWWADPSGD